MEGMESDTKVGIGMFDGGDLCANFDVDGKLFPDLAAQAGRQVKVS